jgi:hypothetical protein
LEPLVEAVVRQESQEDPFTPPTPFCLSLIRQRRASLREDLGQEERTHLESCLHCRQMRATVEGNTWHPAVGDLCRARAGRLGSDEEAVLEAHLESERCRRCARLMASGWLNALARHLAESPAGGITRESDPSVAVGTLRADSVPEALRTVAGFATAAPLPLHVRAASPEGELIVILREASPGQVVITVEAAAPLAGRRVHVEVLGEPPHLPEVVELALLPVASGSLGEERLGSLEKLAPLLAGGATVVAVVLEQGRS